MQVEAPPSAAGASSTQMDSPGVPTEEPEEPEEPWARLIGMGPTSGFGIVDLTARLVEFGNASKNNAAHIRFDDPRIRRVLPSGAPSTRTHTVPLQHVSQPTARVAAPPSPHCAAATIAASSSTARAWRTSST